MCILKRSRSNLPDDDDDLIITWLFALDGDGLTNLHGSGHCLRLPEEVQVKGKLDRILNRWDGINPHLIFTVCVLETGNLFTIIFQMEMYDLMSTCNSSIGLGVSSFQPEKVFLSMFSVQVALMEAW